MGKKVVNLVNFVRGIEPRMPMDLYTPVAKQLEADKAAGLAHTFLLQYDAMQRSDIRELFLRSRDENTELGVWFENCRELIESIGLEWGGRDGYDWDWYVYPGFLEGYSPAEREMIVDAVFAKFKSIFGEYPKVAGSWLMDAHSMRYMSEKYGMKAFCICREQHAVDAYTLWGGYYSGGFYPSRLNMLLPAQSEEYAINVPVFRMLGIDPVFSYDRRSRPQCASGTVCTLEPYADSGRDPDKIECLLSSYFDEPSLSFAHLTTGQENSFGWENFCVGYMRQLQQLRKRVDDGSITVEKLGDTGEWFKKNFRQSPPSALCATRDCLGLGIQSYWYNCKNYRANLFLENGELRLRDVTKFDERYAERYITEGTKSFDAWYDALPIADGCLWVSEERDAGIICSEPVSAMSVEEQGNVLVANITYRSGESGSVIFTESGIRIVGPMPWMYMTGVHDIDTSLEEHERRYTGKGITEIVRTENTFDYLHNGFRYRMEVRADISDCDREYLITPQESAIELVLDLR